MIILGQYFGPHNLLARISYDFNPINTQNTQINVAQLMNSSIYGGDPYYGDLSPYGGQYPIYNWRIFNEKQQCSSIQITLEDSPVVGAFINDQGDEIQVTYNESMSLSSLTFIVGAKKGSNKLAANRSFGV